MSSSGCAPATLRSFSSQYGSLTRNWTVWLPSDPGRGSLWLSTGRFTWWKPLDTFTFIRIYWWFDVLDTRRTGRWSPAAANLRSAGGAGETRMMSTWWHRLQKPVRWELKGLGDNVETHPTPVIVTLVKKKKKKNVCPKRWCNLLSYI